MPKNGLHRPLSLSAQRVPDRLAVSDPSRGRTISYKELDSLSDRLRDRLRAIGVVPGDRVGICLGKSISSVASVFGILKAGGGYVPVDSTAPPERNAFVFSNCEVAAVLVEERFEEALRQELSTAGSTPPLLVLQTETEEDPLRAALDRADQESAAEPVPTFEAEPGDLAYILYTSGSTGKPKGVTLSHENATSFVEWCSEVFSPREDDRFSSHAPFHFDLSILDLYLPIRHGASIHLIGEQLGKNPAGMVQLLSEADLTVWYSTPSVLRLMLEHGGLADLESHSLRYVLYAGEVFPVKHLRELARVVTGPRYFNLYGPTETNVCTYHETPAIVPDERSKPYPIGRVCSHLRARVADEDGKPVAVGEEGELQISGPAVLQGYWNQPERTAAAFIEDDTGRWYRTGDLVIEDEERVYTFVGRRDRMVKRRGYRIELGEIEAAFYRHPEISEAAAVAVSDQEGVTIKTFYSTREGTPLSMIELKRFCAARLPMYMIPDRFTHLEVLPKTSTDKIDYQLLKEVE